MRAIDAQSLKRAGTLTTRIKKAERAIQARSALKTNRSNGLPRSLPPNHKDTDQTRTQQNHGCWFRNCRRRSSDRRRVRCRDRASCCDVRQQCLIRNGKLRREHPDKAARLARRRIHGRTVERNRSDREAG